MTNHETPSPFEAFVSLRHLRVTAHAIQFLVKQRLLWIALLAMTISDVLELQTRQACIEPIRGNERGMRSLLDHAAMLHYQNTIA